jgi:hypothetical protein
MLSWGVILYGAALSIIAAIALAMLLGPERRPAILARHRGAAWPPSPSSVYSAPFSSTSTSTSSSSRPTRWSAITLPPMG